MEKENQEFKLIDFEGGQLLGVRTEDGKVYLGIKKACIDIGMSEKQAERQVANVQEDLVLKSKSLKFGVVQTEGTRQVKREVLVIHEDVVTLWLAKISLTPKMQSENPKAIERLVRYQLKAAKVLHEAFFATEEQKQELFDDLGLKGEIVDLKEEVVSLRNRVTELIDNSTINSRQAQKILESGRNRVNVLLGGAHSSEYKKKSRIYFKNMWNNFADFFKVGSYKDLNPIEIPKAYDYLQQWIYIENI